MFSYPLQFNDPRVRDLRSALASAVFRVEDIQTLVLDAGVPPYIVDWSGPAQRVWIAVLDAAAGQALLDELLRVTMERYPALAPRIKELLAAKPVIAPRVPKTDAIPANDPRWKGFSGDGRERRMVEAQDTMLDVAFLARGVQRAAAVCRLTVSLPSGALTFGTGFLIGAARLLTNHHVVYDWDHGDARATSVLAAFGYELDLDGKLATPVEVQCDVASIRGKREHDFAVIETAGPLPAGVPVLELGSSEPVKVDDRVIIVQHPQNLPKKIALAHNIVRHVDDDVLQYWTDTESGSSGAPVFNERWEVVGLHHWWVESPVDDGSDYRNQGRNIARIVEWLALQDGN
jgi:V8-like Glu-specific endopeptidase